MIIRGAEISRAFRHFGIRPRGALHVGAHACEELDVYGTLGIPPEAVVWIEALPEEVAAARARGIPNVHLALITDVDGQPMSFRVTGNRQSSSILELGTHARHHPEIRVEETRRMDSTTLDTFLATRGLDPSEYALWNLDIQGAELLALKGGSGALAHAKAVYLEVNTEEVYRGCARLEDVDAFLGARGFTRVLTEMTPWGWGDALYVRPPRLRPTTLWRWRLGAPGRWLWNVLLRRWGRR